MTDDVNLKIKIYRSIAHIYKVDNKKKYLLEAAELNDAESQYELYQYYQDKDEEDKAIFWLKMAFKNKHKKAMFEIAKFARYDEDDNSMHPICDELISLNYAGGYLGYFYYYGNKNELEKAFSYLETAINNKDLDRDDTEIYYVYAKCKEEGIGTNIDLDEALKYYLLDGNHLSFYRAYVIFSSKGKKDEALGCLIHSANLGNIYATHELGKISFANGINNAGVFYLTMSANSDNYDAMFDIIEYLFNDQYFSFNMDTKEYMKKIISRANNNLEFDKKYITFKEKNNNADAFFKNFEEKYNYHNCKNKKVKA